ncbi:uncharacterized protein LOC110898255 isoform X1 [Helianthus annuus]|nr:uncharacterized protein LOC110898255 isoform X1 [Helianthus annuus]
MTRRERDSLVVGRVIGDVLDSFTKSINLTISYNDREVSNGCTLKPSQVINQPRVDIGGDDLRAFHTLVMVDPDAPSPSDPNLREYLHWLVTIFPRPLEHVLNQSQALSGHPLDKRSTPRVTRVHHQLRGKPGNPPARRHDGEITGKTRLAQGSNLGFPGFPIISHQGLTLHQVIEELASLKRNASLHHLIYRSLTRQVKKWCATRVQDHQWEFIEWFSCCSGSWVEKLCTPQGGARTSTLETLQSSTILGLPWPQSTSTASVKVDLVDDGDKKKGMSMDRGDYINSY